MSRFLFVVIVLFLMACNKEEESPYTIPENAKLLLAGDSIKTWKLARRFNNDTRMNMGDCFLSYRVSYGSNLKLSDNSGENRGCGETLDATWQFAKDKRGNYYIRMESDQLPQLMNIEENFKLLKILHLSEDQMVLHYLHMQFSNKVTKMTDVFVPESAIIGDRTFHW